MCFSNNSIPAASASGSAFGESLAGESLAKAIEAENRTNPAKNALVKQVNVGERTCKRLPSRMAFLETKEDI